ncbi:phage terminase small subunit P27 family [Comamonas odontotermitis]|uniref:phage terminase small subunit P27 family n=1 Tax=Comamonas odontotermitis TaxID=379895 RepID=UPI001CC767C4|nr:phage terminase small subunit P27 family [Comamonas odontotermitis]UBB19510.1 phage terminase small subunit P27 family [Comamonas odontotermitis]
MAGNSNSGRTAKTPFAHLAGGNPSKRNIGGLLGEIQSAAVMACVPDRPDWLSADAVLEWDRVVAALQLLGWVHQLDMMALASYCEAVADYKKFRILIAQKNAEQAESGDVQTFATGAKQISVWRQLANDAEKRANAAGAQFGMTPLARRNMKAAPVGQADMFGGEEKDAAATYFN